jgi:hypothetical protein
MELLKSHHLGGHPMASIPHPLQLHIAMLLVQAQTHLPTRTRMRLSFVL